MILGLYPLAPLYQTLGVGFIASVFHYNSLSPRAAAHESDVLDVHELGLVVP